MEKLIWPLALVMCAIGGMFIFKADLSAMIKKISAIDKNGITLVQQIDKIDVNLTIIPPMN
jgi:hypothetical protein